MLSHIILGRISKKAKDAAKDDVAHSNSTLLS